MLNTVRSWSTIMTTYKCKDCALTTKKSETYVRVNKSFWGFFSANVRGVCRLPVENRTSLTAAPTFFIILFYATISFIIVSTQFCSGWIRSVSLPSRSKHRDFFLQIRVSVGHHTKFLSNIWRYSTWLRREGLVTYPKQYLRTRYWEICYHSLNWTNSNKIVDSSHVLSFPHY